MGQTENNFCWPKNMPSDPVKAFPFLFYLQITSGTETRKERSLQMRKGRKRERKNDSQTQWPNPRHSGEIVSSSSCRRVLSSCHQSLSFSISLSLLNWVWSSQHHADRDLAFASAVRSHLHLRRAISPLVDSSRLSLFLLLSIWPHLMIFFSGFCFCFCIEEWMILYICLVAEKMWATSRKCVFYGIFKNLTPENIFQNIFWNATKHLKIFSFPKNSISRKYLFSRKYFTWTKHSPNPSFSCKVINWWAYLF